MAIPTLFKSFAKNTGGSVAIWAAFTTPVLVGGAALSVDASRLYNMDNDLQSAADALARAGAAELDQRSDSLERAKRAVQNLVSNDQKFSKDGKGVVEIDTIRFLKSIPINDYDEVQSSDVTYNPSEAMFVEVKVKPETVSTLFPTSLVRKMTDTTLDAKSVAGFDQGVCGGAPIFICNPQEGKAKSIYTAMEDPSFRRKLIQFKTAGGGNTQYGPGNFGYADPKGGNAGAADMREALGKDITNFCMTKSTGITLRPGNIASAAHGFNTRFDIYEGSFNSKKTDPRYAPAANVVKGYSGKNACNTSADPNALAMPRDTCFDTNSCSELEGRFGNGDWDFVEYMKINHNFMKQVTIQGTTYRLDYDEHAVSPAAPPSRYDLYRWEIDTNSVPGKATYGTANTPEEGTPQCHTYGPSTAVEDRRIIHAAVLNCGTIEASGQSMNGRTGALPVETFVKVFVTEPMGKGQDNVIWGEIVGPVIQGEDSPSRDKVALTR